MEQLILTDTWKKIPYRCVLKIVNGVRYYASPTGKDDDKFIIDSPYEASKGLYVKILSLDYPCTLQLGMLPKLSNSGATVVSGSIDKWRDSFNAINTDTWLQQLAPNDFIGVAGNCQGSSFLSLCVSPFNASTRSSLKGVIGERSFVPPCIFGFGLSLSQRESGTLALIRLASVDESGNIILEDGKTDTYVSGTVSLSSITVSSNIATIITQTPHTFQYDDLIVISNAKDTRMNMLIRITSIINQRQFTASLTIANGTYNIGSLCTATKISLDCFANNTTGYAYYDATSSQAVYFTSDSGSTTLVSQQSSFGTAYTDPLIPSSQNFAVNSQPRFNTEIKMTADQVRYMSWPTDSMSIGSSYKRTQCIPDPLKTYVPVLELITLPNRAKPIMITSAVKNGTTTATVTTDTAHMLQDGAYVRIYGAVDQTNFPNIVTETAITYISPTSFSLTWGTSVTQTIYGGIVMPVNGTGSSTGAINTSVRGTTAYANALYVGTNATVPLNIGDVVRVLGTKESTGNERNGINKDQRYRVMALNPNIQGTSVSVSTTLGSPTIIMSDTSQVAVGSYVTGVGIGSNAVVTSIVNNTQIIVSVNSTATGTTQLNMTGVILAPINFSLQDSQPLLIPSGGAIVRETELRLNYMRALDYTRLPVEVTEAKMAPNDNTGAAQVVVVGGSITATANEGTPMTPSTLQLTSAASTNLTSVKTSAGTIWAIWVTNTTASTLYVKLFNKTSAPTLGTDIPYAIIEIPAGKFVPLETGRSGLRFPAGIALATTVGIADTDAVAVTAGALKILLSYS